MPLNKKGKEIMSAMDKEYGYKKGKQVFYASKNKGTIKGVDSSKKKALENKSGKNDKSLYPKKYDVKKGSATWRQKMKDVKRKVEETKD